MNIDFNLDYNPNNIYYLLLFLIFLNIFIKINGEENIINNNNVCLPPGYSPFYLEYDNDIYFNHISVFNTIIFKITGTDLYGNK